MSDVARWHLLSGLPDNVTDEGQVVAPAAGMRLQSEKDLLRAEIATLRDRDDAPEAAGLARLAASYLLCGDVETAARYLKSARESLTSAPADMKAMGDESDRADPAERRATG